MATGDSLDMHQAMWLWMFCQFSVPVAKCSKSSICYRFWNANFDVKPLLHDLLKEHIKYRGGSSELAANKCTSNHVGCQMQIHRTRSCSCRNRKSDWLKIRNLMFFVFKYPIRYHVLGVKEAFQLLHALVVTRRPCMKTPIVCDLEIQALTEA